MKSQSAKQKVLAIFPNAIVIEDEDCGLNTYSSSWAEEAKFAVGYFLTEQPVGPGKCLKTTFNEIIKHDDWNFLAGWRQNPTAAWKSAWESIGAQMISKLEQQ